MSDILTAISRGCKGTMVDGSVRYTIEFGPLDAVAAATLFGMPGTEMGVVALKDGRDHDKQVIYSCGPNGEAIPMAIETLPERRKSTKPTKDGRDHTEDVLDMVPYGDQNADSGDEKDGTGPNDAALPMASDQVADTGKTIKTAQSDLVKWSGVLSNDKQFWEWVGLRSDKPTTAEEAAAYIRRRCIITSRSHLAHDAGAASIFRSIMRGFDEWSKK